MSLRFRRTKKIAPGVRLNVGKKNVSLRVGGRGFGVTVGTAGARVSAGIPGTGLYVTERLPLAGTGRRKMSGSAPRPAAPIPPEPGVRAPTGWIVATVVLVLMALGGVVYAIPAAVGTAWVAWGRYRSPRFVALKEIRRARTLVKTDAAEADSTVRTAAERAGDSWTVQREAASYFVLREDPASALPYFSGALGTFPGDRRGLLLEASEAALAAGRHDWIIETLEPAVSSLRPDESDVDAALLAVFALAQIGVGEAGKALELTKRLPLRRRNLSPPLLFGLCVRSLAKHFSGQRAAARRDLDRAYAMDPGFPFLNTAQRLIDGDEGSLP